MVTERTKMLGSVNACPVTYLGGDGASVAIVVLEVVHTPGGVRGGIVLFKIEGPGPARAGLGSGVGVHAKLETKGVHLVRG